MGLLYRRYLALLLGLCMLLSGCVHTTDLGSLPPIPSETDPTVSLPPTDPPPTDPPPTSPPEDPRSIRNFLWIAAQPLGSTMYIWGGGWNEADTAAGTEAVSIGLSPAWAEFARQQSAGYDHNDYRYHIHKGLDCSGYVGWAVYNLLETENGKEGYVFSSTVMAQTLADKGFGQYIPAGEMTQWLPGDIMSMKGHVWIVVGQCEDGSVLLLHASPPGVILSGTTHPDGSKSQAVSLAEEVMRSVYPDWYARFPDCARPYSYLEKSSAMRWQILSDEAGLRNMTAEQIVCLLFGLDMT